MTYSVVCSSRYKNAYYEDINHCTIFNLEQSRRTSKSIQILQKLIIGHELRMIGTV